MDSASSLADGLRERLVRKFPGTFERLESLRVIRAGIARRTGRATCAGGQST